MGPFILVLGCKTAYISRDQAHTRWEHSTFFLCYFFLLFFCLSTYSYLHHTSLCSLHFSLSLCVPIFFVEYVFLFCPLVVIIPRCPPVTLSLFLTVLFYCFSFYVPEFDKGYLHTRIHKSTILFNCPGKWKVLNVRMEKSNHLWGIFNTLQALN